MCAPDKRFAFLDFTFPAGTNIDGFSPPEIVKWTGWNFLAAASGPMKYRVWWLGRSASGGVIEMGAPYPPYAARDTFSDLGRRLDSEAPSAETVDRWVDSLFARASELGIEIQSGTVKCKTNDGATVDVGVRMIVDGAQASRALIHQLESQEPEAIEAAQPGARSREKWVFTTDHRSATKGSKSHTFTSGQAEAICALRDAADKGRGALTNREIGARIAEP